MTDRTASDEVLIERIRAGESSLYGIIVDRHQRSLHRLISGILRGDSEADDVLQEAHFRAFTRLHQFRQESQFSTWLRRIAVNQALQYLRSACRVQYAGDEWVPEFDTADRPTLSQAPDPEHQTSAEEIGEVLENAVQKLSPPLRSVFVLREIELLSTREISYRLGITEACVKTRLHRAKIQLRRSLRDITDTPVSSNRGWQASPSIPALAAEAA